MNEGGSVRSAGTYPAGPPDPLEVRRLREENALLRAHWQGGSPGIPVMGTEAIADSLDETVEDLSEYAHDRTGPSAAVEWNQTRRLLCERRQGDRRVGLGLDASDRRGATWWQRLTNFRYRTADRRQRDE